MKIALDIETNALVNPDIIHCVVCRDIDTNEVFKFLDGEQDALRSLIERATMVVIHNGIAFDLKHLSRLWGISVPREKVFDTLVVSRLINQKIEGGHSLEAWGVRLGFPKQDFKDFSKLTREMVEYCTNDTLVLAKLYLRLLPILERNKESFAYAIELEHYIAYVCEEMSDNGFSFDYDEAKRLHTEIVSRIEEIDKQLLQDFPPKSRFVKEVTPKLNANGTFYTPSIKFMGPENFKYLSEGGTFSRVEFEPFNPSSPKQIVERLNECGWKPIEKTKGHLQNKDKNKKEHYKKYGWKVNENNLQTLPADAPASAHRLCERIVLDSRRSTLEEWFAAYSPETKRIHGRFNSIGTWTHRMSHKEPNVGNIAAEKSLKFKGDYLAGVVKNYGRAFRSLWRADPERNAYLVGTDAQGIQLRVLAHYMDDPEFTKELLDGDVHTLNQKKLGEVCRSRDNAKTFIYAFLLGAGIGKVAEIFFTTNALANQAMQQFLDGYPGLKTLKDRIIPNDARRGFFVGFDGRKVICDSEHLMLAGYLQNGEAVVMKVATRIWKEKLDELGIEYKLVNFVHDEWVIEVYSKDDAELVKEITTNAVYQAGELLKLRCRMDGSSQIGKTWYDVH